MSIAGTDGTDCSSLFSCASSGFVSLIDSCGMLLALLLGNKTLMFILNPVYGVKLVIIIAKYYSGEILHYWVSFNN